MKTMSTTHKYPNTNHGLIIEVEDDRIWSSVGDYNEWLDNAFSIEKSDSSVRNMNTDVFGDISGHFGYLYEELNTNIGAYVEPMAENAKRNWERTLEYIKGTHSPSEFQPVDYDKAAFEIWEARWKPIYASQIKWLEERLEDDTQEIYDDYLEPIQRYITYSAFDLFDGFEMDLDELLEDHDDVQKYTKAWIAHLQNQMSTESHNFTVHTLDMFMEFQHEMWNSATNWELTSADGEGKLDINTALRETAVDLYVNKNPNIWVCKVQEGHYNYQLVAHTQTGLTWDADEIDEQNSFIIAKDNEVALSVANGINQFLNGDFYYARTVYFVPENEEHLHDDMEEIDGEKYIETGDSCGGFDSEDSAIEHFSHLRNEPALKPTISYSTLGNVKNA